MFLIRCDVYLSFFLRLFRLEWEARIWLLEVVDYTHKCEIYDMDVGITNLILFAYAIEIMICDSDHIQKNPCFNRCTFLYFSAFLHFLTLFMLSAGWQDAVALAIYHLQSQRVRKIQYTSMSCFFIFKILAYCSRYGVDCRIIFKHVANLLWWQTKHNYDDVEKLCFSYIKL